MTARDITAAIGAHNRNTIENGPHMSQLDNLYTVAWTTDAGLGRRTRIEAASRQSAYLAVAAMPGFFRGSAPAIVEALDALGAPLDPDDKPIPSVASPTIDYQR